MNSTTFPDSAINVLTNLPDPIAADLQKLEQLIMNQLHSDVMLAKEVSEHIIYAGGKRIRPLLTILVARSLHYDGVDHHTLAAIIEFIHTASLLHDDVVDESTVRRGIESANARFGNAASVLVGDFMHTRAFQMMLSLKDMRVMEILAEATNTIAEGEIFQLMKTARTDIDEADYFKIIHAKTAKLFEAATTLGAWVATRDSDLLSAASVYGRSLGMSFQLIDDYLDYAGDKASLGKEIGNDLKEGKMTLPLIYLMAQGTSHEKEMIGAYIERKEDIYFEKIIEAVRQSDALSYVLEEAKKLAKEALNAISNFPDNEYRQCLKQLCHFAVNRKY